MRKLETLEAVQEAFQNRRSPFGPDSGDEAIFMDHCHIGSIELSKDYKETEAYKSLDWLMKNKLPKLKHVKWKEASKLIDERLYDYSNTTKLQPFNQLQHQAYVYQYYLQYGYTEKPETPIPGHSGFDFKNRNDEYQKITDYTKYVFGAEGPTERQLEINNSTYYHSAKAHWLIDSIKHEGLWNPIQGVVNKPSSEEERYTLRIHPGSVRSAVFEMIDDPDMEMFVWDKFDLFNSEVLSAEQVIELWKAFVEKKDKPTHLSFTYTEGFIEMHSAFADIGFRSTVTDFNKNIMKMAKGKPISIYVGYDSRHGDLAETNVKLLQKGIEYGFGKGDMYEFLKDWQPNIKILDVSKIPEYTREYANQSTEFTYSRFLIPYLENYEGFSIFLDDDILFSKSILPLFYFLDPKDAIACVQYDFENHSDTKFDGEKNVSYPKKLWSSLMVFNNAHEDCKKLTPEVVNTESGKYLHQFEWTDKISRIPPRHIITEGYETHLDKPHALAIHWTRGGPWIKDMDTSDINMLDVYERAYAKANKE